MTTTERRLSEISSLTDWLAADLVAGVGRQARHAHNRVALNVAAAALMVWALLGEPRTWVCLLELVLLAAALWRLHRNGPVLRYWNAQVRAARNVQQRVRELELRQ